MRTVLDTNVLIAAFIARGVCNELLEYCALNHDIVSSSFILDEFRSKLVDKFGFNEKEVASTLRLLETRCELVTPHDLPSPICRDPDDDAVIGTALAGACTCIVTGDKDLLDLEMVSGIKIIQPSQFWEFEAR